MAAELDRVGFLLHHPETFHHYENVWRHMPAGSVEVLATGQPAVFERIVEGCRRHQLPWRDAGQLLRDKQRFTTVVSSFPAMGIANPALTKSLARFSLRFMYGNGKSGWNFSPWNSIYDSILCFGPHQVEQLSFCQNTLKVQMGYPRFDRFFNEPLDRHKRLQQLQLDPARKTVVWLPTWSRLSSIDAFAKAVTALQEHHNVIVKPHPITLSDEPWRMRQLESIACVIRESINNVELFQLADVLLCDYGGSAFGAIYTDRDVVLLDLPNAANDPALGADCSDVSLRQYIPHVPAEEAELLPVLLTDKAESIWAEQPKVRSVLREYYFAPYFGYASQVAALAITHAPRAQASAA